MKNVNAVLALAALALAASKARAAEIEPVIIYTHTSDILRGAPFYKDARPDPTLDFLAIGVTVSWNRFELDLTQGVKSQDCNYLNTQGWYVEANHGGCKWESGTAVSVRWYPWRAR